MEEAQYLCERSANAVPAIIGAFHTCMSIALLRALLSISSRYNVTGNWQAQECCGTGPVSRVFPGTEENS
jgi:hypothetical protein